MATSVGRLSAGGDKRNVPSVGWADHLARFIRKNHVVVFVYAVITDRLVPFFLAVIVAAPVGLLILPIFIPKFIRNAQRRRKYEPHWAQAPVERMPPDPVEPPDSSRRPQ